MAARKKPETQIVKLNPAPQLYSALASKYEAQRSEALAILQVYFHNPVGIGEHPDLPAEMDKYVEQVANAEDKLHALEKWFSEFS